MYEYLCGYNAAGLVIGVWTYLQGSDLTPVSQQVPGVSAYEDVTSLYGTPACPGPGWTRTGTLTYTPPAPAVVPDPNGFIMAIVGSAISQGGLGTVMTYLCALQMALAANNVAAIAAVWTASVKPQLSLSDSQIVLAAAETANIPGIS